MNPKKYLRSCVPRFFSQSSKATDRNSRNVQAARVNASMIDLRSLLLRDLEEQHKQNATTTQTKQTNRRRNSSPPSFSTPLGWVLGALVVLLLHPPSFFVDMYGYLFASMNE